MAGVLQTSPDDYANTVMEFNGLGKVNHPPNGSALARDVGCAIPGVTLEGGCEIFPAL